MLVAMAWRNLWRHRRRTFITATAMGVSAGLVMGMLAYTDGMYQKMAEVMIDQTTGHVQVNHPDWTAKRAMYDTVPQATARVDAIAALPGTRAVAPRLHGYALLGTEAQSAGAQLIGVVPARERGVEPIDQRVVQGAWLSEGGDREIVLGSGLAKSLQAQVGGQVVAVTQASDGSLGNDLYTVVGILASGSVARDRSGAWVHLDDLQELMVLPDQVHEVLVLAPTREARVDDPAVKDAAAGVTAAVAAPGDGAALSVKTWWEASPMTAQMMAMSDANVGIMLGIVFSVAGLGVLNTMLMSVFERTRELGVMKALGTRPRTIVALVVTESLLLGLLSAGAGLVLGGLLDVYMVTHGIRFTLESGERLSTAGVLFDPLIKGVVKPERIVVTLVAMQVVAVGAALWPALRAARLQPIDAMQDR